MARKPIDWCQLLHPGPKRAFTTGEMARAGSDSPSPTLLANAAINVAAIAFVVLQLTPASQTARLSAVLVALAVVGGAAARWLWRLPWARSLVQAQVGVAATVVLMMLGIRWRVPDRADREAIGLALALGMLLLLSALWHTGGDALIRAPLKELLAQLDEQLFWQVHRSVIVNHRHIAAAVRVDEGNMHLTLRGRSERLPGSRHFQALFKGQ